MKRSAGVAIAALLVAGCIGPSPTQPYFGGPAFCVIDELVIYEYGDQRITPDGLEMALSELRKLWPDIRASFASMPATPEGSDWALPRYEPHPTVLPVLYTDTHDFDTPFGTSWGSFVVLYPRTWKEGLAVGPVYVGAPVTYETDSWAYVDASVLLHEVGHSIGLVNNGIPDTVGREHPEHPLHSVHSEDLMYPFGSHADILNVTNWRLEFSDADWQDLNAAREPGGPCHR